MAEAFNEALLQGFVAELSGGSCGRAEWRQLWQSSVAELMAEIVAELSGGA